MSDEFSPSGSFTDDQEILLEKPNKSPKKHQINIHREEWEHIDEYKGWLTKCPSNDPKRSYCLICKKSFVSGRNTISKHAASSYHKLKLENPNYDNLEEPVKPKRTYHRKEWESLEPFRGWLTCAAGGLKSHCKFCHKDLASGKSELLTHARTSLHQSVAGVFKGGNSSDDNKAECCGDDPLGSPAGAGVTYVSNPVPPQPHPPPPPPEAKDEDLEFALSIVPSLRRLSKKDPALNMDARIDIMKILQTKLYSPPNNYTVYINPAPSNQTQTLSVTGNTAQWLPANPSTSPYK